uniref:Peptidase A1 domain-containing protein n=1 Tax=Heterorhabditis bacteriophora TaxID=37862 RepID=A0A1I7XEN7_HETBA
MFALQALNGMVLLVTALGTTTDCIKSKSNLYLLMIRCGSFISPNPVFMLDTHIVGKLQPTLSNKWLLKACKNSLFLVICYLCLLLKFYEEISYSDRVFVLGPSHVVCLNGCAITTCSKYRTPIGDLYVDLGAEHSIEMQMPFIVKVMERNSAIQTSRSYRFWLDHCLYRNSRLTEKFLPTILKTPEISSSFHLISVIGGMDAIETLNPQVFNEYLKRTQNTICGRNPITVMLQAAEHFRMINNHTHEFRFLKYSQSNKVKARNTNDSSVSYAAGALFMHPKG